ncbi:hypothetical protein MHBO_001684 [Bonamia ostreae]|uniref:CSD domain-containing protein n=1 Tax=Bonamia ostreae TaxID=126728 RepID=A0ABV2AKY8_9EUKA
MSQNSVLQIPDRKTDSNPVSIKPSEHPDTEFHANNTVAPGNVPLQKVRGRCKWFNPEKGFGFIVPYSGGKDIFIHQSEIVAEKNRLRSLENGEEVEFTFYTNDRNKRRARDVRMPGGKPVRGKPRKYLLELQNEKMELEEKEGGAEDKYNIYPQVQQQVPQNLIEYQVNGITYHPAVEEVSDYMVLYATLWDNANQPLCDIWKFNDEFFVLGS